MANSIQSPSTPRLAVTPTSTSSTSSSGFSTVLAQTEAGSATRQAESYSWGEDGSINGWLEAYVFYGRPSDYVISRMYVGEDSSKKLYRIDRRVNDGFPTDNEIEGAPQIPYWSTFNGFTPIYFFNRLPTNFYTQSNIPKLDEAEFFLDTKLKQKIQLNAEEPNLVNKNPILYRLDDEAIDVIEGGNGNDLLKMPGRIKSLKEGDKVHHDFFNGGKGNDIVYLEGKRKDYQLNKLLGTNDFTNDPVYEIQALKGGGGSLLVANVEKLWFRQEKGANQIVNLADVIPRVGPVVTQPAS